MEMHSVKVVVHIVCSVIKVHGLLIGGVITLGFVGFLKFLLYSFSV